MKKLSKIVSYLVLALMLVSSCLVFSGVMSVDANKTYMLLLTILWFISAPVWMLDADKNS